MFDLVNLDKNSLNDVITNTAIRKNLSPAIIEKDLLVCAILNYLFTECPWKDNLAFKGGTSLSKAFNLIERFSEDIDLILDWRIVGYETKEPLAERSNTKQDALNKEFDVKTEEFLKSTFIPKLKEDLKSLINRSLDISYENETIIIGYGNDYADESILHVIRLEIGAKAAWTPTEAVTIRPYIAEVYPEQFGTLPFQFVPLRQSALSGRRQQFFITKPIARMICRFRLGFHVTTTMFTVWQSLVFSIEL